MKKHALFGLGLAVMLGSYAAHAGDLNVEITVPAQKQGPVLVALFDKAEGFPRGTPIRTAIAQPANGKAVLQFAGLAAGEYAFSAFLDENSNTKLDTNVFGLPTELFGFSRNARNPLGPPPFADAAFRMDDGASKHAIELK